MRVIAVSADAAITLVDESSACNDDSVAQGEKVYQAAGAIKTFRTPPYPSTHNLGTCRMGADRNTSVCNRFGQTHDVANRFIFDGSQFASGGAENPTLTIVTLAIRQADHIASQLTARAL